MVGSSWGHLRNSSWLEVVAATSKPAKGGLGGEISSFLAFPQELIRSPRIELGGPITLGVW